MSFVLLGILNSQAAGAVGAGAYDLLETQTLSTAAASVTFTGLGSYTDYKHLQVRAVGRSSFGSIDFLDLVVNSDTGSNYARHRLQGNGSSVTSGSGTSQSKLGLGQLNDDNSTANAFTAYVIDVLDFSSTSKNKTFRTLSGRADSGNVIMLRSGLYISTNAITDLEFSSAQSANLLAGSRFSLYGVK
mgnify:CR=1 FL=1